MAESTEVIEERTCDKKNAATAEVHALGVNEFVEKEVSLHRLGDALKRLLKPPVHA